MPKQVVLRRRDATKDVYERVNVKKVRLEIIVGLFVVVRFFTKEDLH